MKNTTAFLAGLLLAALVAGCAPSTDTAPPQAELLVALPDYCNTPDGMALLPDNSVIVSVPNFNDETKPPLLMRITPDNRAEKFYDFPTPYPGLAQGIDRIAPMGMVAAPSGDLYLADMQYMKDKNQKSRLWRLVVKAGKVDKMVLVARGFNVANGLAIRDGHVYVTESVLEEESQPLTSAVLRFRLEDENVQLKTPLKDDPHIIATFKSYLNDWRFGADGIEFDSRGNLFVGLFGDGVMHKITFDASGNVKANEVFAKAPGKLVSCDGMHRDAADNLYVADSAANAIQIIRPNGRVETLWQNEDVADKRTGQIDQPCEALVRGNEIIVSNMDWPFPKFKNSKHQLPATLSIIRLERR
ncbi:MAG: SMP-30/gluconolactonase/LRE family protein [Verrucomicrobia bacterium]|nr:SMP-30/gluconolactonase/LRE family protein [Verrucomicrobiota bacterium]